MGGELCSANRKYLTIEDSFDASIMLLVMYGAHRGYMRTMVCLHCVMIMPGYSRKLSRVLSTSMLMHTNSMLCAIQIRQAGSVDNFQCEVSDDD